MVVRQICCLYLVAVRADCVCECRFTENTLQRLVASCGSRGYCREIFPITLTNYVVFCMRNR